MIILSKKCYVTINYSNESADIFYNIMAEKNRRITGHYYDITMKPAMILVKSIFHIWFM